jgi:hypothetical protein
MGVEVAFTSMYHPQSNGAVEKVNTLIFVAIKKILEVSRKENEHKNCQEQYGAIILLYVE